MNKVKNPYVHSKGITLVENSDMRNNTVKLFDVVKYGDNNIIERVNELVKSGVDINSWDDDRESVLMLAVRERMDMELVKELIKLGANVNMSHHTPLLLKVLEYKGVIVYKDKDGKYRETTENMNEDDILNMRVWENGKDMVSMLVKQYNVDINKFDRMGDTLLHKGMKSIYNVPEKLIWWLVEDLKSDVNQSNFTGNSALHYAVKCGCNNKSMVSMMLRNGGDPNKENHKGKTVLYYAVKNGDDYKDIVKLMMEMGGDPIVPNHKGRTPLQYAEKNGDNYKDIVELMMKQVLCKCSRCIYHNRKKNTKDD